MIVKMWDKEPLSLFSLKSQDIFSTFANELRRLFSRYIKKKKRYAYLVS